MPKLRIGQILLTVEEHGGFEVESLRGDLNLICSLSAPRACFVVQTATALHAMTIVLICVIAVLCVYLAQ